MVTPAGPRGPPPAPKTAPISSARLGRPHKAPGLPAAHDPRLGPDVVRLETAALPDALVRAPVRLEAPVEPGLVAVERVRVLHYELAHAQEPAPRPRLVAFLSRE